jgi:hypothetical protein
MRSDNSGAHLAWLLGLILTVAVALPGMLGVFTPSVAHAQNWSEDTAFARHSKFSLTALFGVTGSAKLSTTKLDLDPTYGVSARYERPLNLFLVLGGAFGIAAWVPSLSNDRGAGRSTLFDLELLVKLRYPISERFEIYLVAPFGGTLDSGDNTNFGGITNFGGGWVFEPRVGTHLGLSPSTGLVFEGGYSVHSFSHNIKSSGGTIHYTIDVQVQQPTFLFGFYART